MRTRSTRGAYLLAAPFFCLAVAAACSVSDSPGSDPGGPADGSSSDATRDAPSTPDAEPISDAQAPSDATTDSTTPDASDASVDGPTCGTHLHESRPTPAYFLVLLDASARMDGMATQGGALLYAAASRETDGANTARPTIADGAGVNGQAGKGPAGATGKKWLAVRQALGSAWAYLANQNAASPSNPSWAAGLHVIGSTTPASDSAADVPVAFLDSAQSSRLNARIAPVVADNGAASFPTGNVYPKGDFTLAAALKGQGRVLADATAPSMPGGARRVLVVVADTFPSDDPEPSSPNSPSVNTVYGLAHGSHGPERVLTAVIGVGDATATADYNAPYLGHLASAGGLAPAGCNPNWPAVDAGAANQPCYQQVTPGGASSGELDQDLLDAFTAIFNRVSACDLLVDAPLSSIGSVLYVSGSGDTTTVPKSVTNGWSQEQDAPSPMLRATHVLLHGKACDTFKADANGKIRVLGNDCPPPPSH